jgi:hypothetical protein
LLRGADLVPRRSRRKNFFRPSDERKPPYRET